MSSTDVGGEPTRQAESALGVDMNIEVATFNDPDGNGWEWPVITTRLPGRAWEA